MRRSSRAAPDGEGDREMKFDPCLARNRVLSRSSRAIVHEGREFLVGSLSRQVIVCYSKYGEDCCAPKSRPTLMVVIKKSDAIRCVEAALQLAWQQALRLTPPIIAQSLLLVCIRHCC